MGLKKTKKGLLKEGQLLIRTRTTYAERQARPEPEHWLCVADRRQLCVITERGRVAEFGEWRKEKDWKSERKQKDCLYETEGEWMKEFRGSRGTWKNSCMHGIYSATGNSPLRFIFSPAPFLNQTHIWSKRQRPSMCLSSSGFKG